VIGSGNLDRGAAVRCWIQGFLPTAAACGALGGRAATREPRASGWVLPSLPGGRRLAERLARDPAATGRGAGRTEATPPPRCCPAQGEATASQSRTARVGRRGVTSSQGGEGGAPAPRLDQNGAARAPGPGPGGRGRAGGPGAAGLGGPMWLRARHKLVRLSAQLLKPVRARFARAGGGGPLPWRAPGPLAGTVADLRSARKTL